VKSNLDAVRQSQRASRQKNKEKYKPVALQYYYANRDSLLKRQKEWRAANRDRVKYHNDKNQTHRLYDLYGITLEQKVNLLASQGGVCAICQCVDTSKRPWHVDHCHVTKKIRGILCTHCNVMLGRARDNPEVLRTAAVYLEAHK
jgi:hypothetical protein